MAQLQGLPGTVMIKHDMDVALAVSELVTVMQDGKVVAGLTPDAIQDDPVVRAIYLGDGSAAH